MEENKIEEVKNTEQKRGGSSPVSAICIALAVVISSAILSYGFVYYKTSGDNDIKATGSASVDFESDMIVWRGNFSQEAGTSRIAYEKIKSDADIVKDYLRKQGLSDKEIVFSSVDVSRTTEDRYNDEGNFIGSYYTGYKLTQSITVTSEKIDAVEEISRNISTLIESGVELESWSPEYYKTNLDDVKMELIGRATENARERIDIMARGTGAKVGRLKNSELGVIQITPMNSGTSSYTYDGAFDTSSRYKTATITVRLDYAVK
ncbi:MAG: SIMPL domain-containing protein [Lachnospiraceae bacterium]|nr:SIMPL domain-containing protein [Lachnospiraceae bacterium]